MGWRGVGWALGWCGRCGWLGRSQGTGGRSCWRAPTCTGDAGCDVKMQRPISTIQLLWAQTLRPCAPTFLLRAACPLPVGHGQSDRRFPHLLPNLAIAAAPFHLRMPPSRRRALLTGSSRRTALLHLRLSLQWRAPRCAAPPPRLNTTLSPRSGCRGGSGGGRSHWANSLAQKDDSGGRRGRFQSLFSTLARRRLRSSK